MSGTSVCTSHSEPEAGLSGQAAGTVGKAVGRHAIGRHGDGDGDDGPAFTPLGQLLQAVGQTNRGTVLAIIDIQRGVTVASVLRITGRQKNLHKQRLAQGRGRHAQDQHLACIRMQAFGGLRIKTGTQGHAHDCHYPRQGFTPRSISLS
jgi:hypothetical protein